jgi:hypothetical protein
MRENEEDDAMLRNMDDDDDISEIDEDERMEHAADLEVVAAVNDDIKCDGLDDLVLTHEDVNLGWFSLQKVCCTRRSLIL